MARARALGTRYESQIDERYNNGRLLNVNCRSKNLSGNAKYNFFISMQREINRPGDTGEGEVIRIAM